MSVLAIFLNKHNPNNWRPTERDSMERTFGPIVEVGPQDDWKEASNGCDTIFWRLDAEKTTNDILGAGKAMSLHFTNCGMNQINNPLSWDCVHAKDYCFEVWFNNGIPTPKWFTFDGDKEYWDRIRMLNYPVLFRINDANTGEASGLIKNGGMSRSALKAMDSAERNMRTKYGPGVHRKWMAVEFIENLFRGYRYSYRIIVAGNKVVTGYARMCKPPEWIAITDRFTSNMGSVFIELQKRCQAFCKKHEELLVKSVRCLGLNWQGVDVMERPDGTPAFLEVQPDFSCGNELGGDVGPWYNPSYPHLVKFIKANEDKFRSSCPMYYNTWLPKERMFNQCHQALKDSF